MTKNGNSHPVPVEEKPLNQGQLKNLRELVEGDFRDLQEQIALDINRREQEKIKEIEERFDDESDLDGFRERIRQMARDFEDQMEALLTEAREQGITTSQQSHRKVYEIDVYPNNLKQMNKEKEIDQVQRAASQMRQTANRVLNREQRSVQRQCLLQGIGATGAHELIRDLPRQDDLVPLINAEIAMHNQADAKVLMSSAEIKALEKETK